MRDDRVTLRARCPVCQTPLVSAGRRRYCSAACRQRAHRQRHAETVPAAALVPRPRAAIVYACPNCEARYLGEQRCPDCNIFCRRLGPGGACPHCEEPVALAELVTLRP